MPDASRWDRAKLAWTILRVLWLVIRLRPDAIVSTGAAPGYFALRFGKIVGARTLWLDSLANAGELSLSGKKASKFADLTLTQWAHLGKPVERELALRRGTIFFSGSVL